ncbi:CARDB domain-containing protein [Stieleria varia]|uniref:CARDB domain-containing protein n=1 Tax=Stieleria varia TaxID=2528005 RepID=A0A5C5ZX92_9BACT|nr:CARDB domain-containing protein [Stieleria varia]TWT91760.1 hypothetical protein Pla52n_65100 [Stieleria varia]
MIRRRRYPHCRLRLEVLEKRRLLATYTVNSTADEGDSYLDDGICDTANHPGTDPPTPPSGICTLRAALQQTASRGGGDTIEFAIPGDSEFFPEIPGGLGIAANVILDGTTQTSGRVIIQGPVNVFGDGAMIKGVFVQDELRIGTNNNTIQQSIFETLTVNGSQNQIGGVEVDETVVVLAGGLEITGSNNVLEGSYVGFNPETSMSDSNPNAEGISISGLANRIGGSAPGAGNVIGGFRVGVAIGSNDLNTPIPNAGNSVLGNFIGILPDDTPLPNTQAGIRLVEITGNLIGGSESGQGNVISSSAIGIQLSQGASENTIQGNFIGTTVDGSGAMSGQLIGIDIDPQGRPDRPPIMNVIGGLDPGAGNVIAGNGEYGIRIYNGPRENIIDGNLIGIGAFEAPLSNGTGIDVTFAADNLIGGPVGNTISGNKTGVVIAGNTASGNRIVGNRIGTNVDGDAAIGNNTGILINDAPGTIIGGPVSDQSQLILGNVISGSVAIPAEGIPGHGIFIANGNAQGTIVQGNRIGTNASGTAALPNAGDGILISDASGTQIGGDQADQANLISGNGGDGVTVLGSNALPPVTGTVIEGNRIGTGADGTAAIGNTFRGVHLDGNVSGTRLGGELPGSRNLISGNGMDGVIVFGGEARENEIYGNTIGLNQAGNAKLPNGGAGILIQHAPANLIGKAIDTDVYGNLISGNQGDGLRIEGSIATENVAIGNLIGVGVIGDEQLGNRGDGVRIIDASDNRIGPYTALVSGAFPRGANVISDNFNNGIRIEGTATGNQILGNGIGTSSSGQVNENVRVLGNLENGIEIIDASDNWIGGRPDVAIPSTATIPQALAANRIAINGFDGVRIMGDDATGNRILSNSIFANGGQGIDLGAAGVTDNDIPAIGLPDTDVGPNGLQNYPTIDQLQTSSDKQTVRLTAQLATTPSQTYTVQVFSNFIQEDAGEGRILLETVEVQVGASGIADFFVDVAAPQPNATRNGQRASFFAMTATDPDGNTSEFSPSATAPELVVDGLDVTLDKFSFENGEFIFRDTIIVRNEGGRDAENVLLQIRDQDGNTIEPFDLDQFVTLPAATGQPNDVMVDIQWNVTQLLLDAQGQRSLGLTVTLDPNNTVSELVDDVENNTQSQSVSVDIRPRIDAADVKREYKSGVFLAGVNLENEIRVESVDWNGNLPGTDLGSSVSRELRLEAGSKSESVLILGASSPPFDFSFDLGEDLTPGTSRVTLTATSFSALPPTVFPLDYTQIENPEWIGDVLVTVEDVGNGPYDKVAKYHAGFGFPGFVTDGFFELPVTVTLGAGSLGPEIGSYEVDLDFRSDGIASLTGKGPWSGMIAGRQVFPEVDVEISGTAKPSDGTLKLISASTTVSLEGDVESPKVPLPPPVSFLSAHGELNGALSATLSVIEQADGTLDWEPAGFGIGVGAAIKISAGFEGLAYAEGGVGGNINANFNVPADPCLLDELTLQFALTAEVHVLIAKAEYEFNFPDPPFHLAGCNAGAQGAAASVAGEGLTPTLTLADSTAGAHFATLDVDGMPDIRYRFAAPSLAVANDGAKTLVWVDEDPMKPVEGRLEIMAARQVNGVWQSPIAITDDSLLDVQPTVGLMPDGTPVAVWNHVGAAVSDTVTPDPYALLDSMDLYYSVFNLSTQSWSAPALVTADVGMDYLPDLTQTSNGLVLTYLNDADGNTSLFADDEIAVDSSIEQLSFDGVSWANAETVASSAQVASVPHAVHADLGNNIEALVVWEDVSASKPAGLPLSIRQSGAWSTTTVLTSQPHAVSPQVIALSGGEAAGLVWLNQQVSTGMDPEDTADEIHFTTFENGQIGSPTLVVQSPGLSDPVMTLDESGRVIVAWVESFADGVGVGYAIQDTDGTWGMPQRMETPADELPWWLLPFAQNGEFNVLNLSRTITTDTGGAEGEGPNGGTPILTTSGLVLSSSPVGPDLTIGPISFDTSTPGVLLVNSVVTNTGDLASDPMQVQLNIDAVPRPESPLMIPALTPGESMQVSFSLNELVDPSAAVNFEIAVDVRDDVLEKDESNNTASADHYLPNLQPQHLTANLVGSDLVISAEIISNGVSPTGAETVVRLMADDPHVGTVLHEVAIGSLAPNESSPFNFTIADARDTLGGVVTAYLVVDATNVVGELMEGFDNREIISLNPYDSWTNPDDPFDVGANGTHTALDALEIINELRTGGIRRLPVPPTPTPFFDPNGDGRISALDALVIINQLWLEYRENNEFEALPATGFSEAITPLPPTALLDRSKSPVVARQALLPFRLTRSDEQHRDKVRKDDGHLEVLAEVDGIPSDVATIDQVVQGWRASAALDPENEANSFREEERYDELAIDKLMLDQRAVSEWILA